MAENQVKISELFAKEHTKAQKIFEFEYPWEVLSRIKEIILDIGESLSAELYEKRGEGIWIAKSANVAESAYIGAPCIIGERTEVRHCAFIRGSALIGDDCVVGNSVELKNCILFDSVQVPHYNYVGDSILGYKSHMGAGSITSNVKSDKSLVVVKRRDGVNYQTGLKKMGAALGDYVEVGCNSVLNPGTVVGRESNIYPLSSVRGVIPSQSIFKSGGVIVPKEKI
jgi:NDP-sugar pyrophosphorylase family protein